MTPQNAARLLDAIAAESVPDTLDLTPRVLSRLAPTGKLPNPNWRNFMHTLRAKPAVALLLLLLTLALLTGAAYALGRSLGYIPGVGIIEQNAPIRVLAEPVSLTREGITLTVDEAVLVSDRAVISYTITGIPPEARPKGEAGFACRPSDPSLRLPDGATLNLTGGEGNSTRTTLIYPPIPLDVNTVAFLLPCLPDVAPGAAPQDWELTLRFVPAPPDLTMAPVLQIATPPPTPTPPPVANLAQSDTFMGLSFHLEAIQNTGRGYLLETSLRWEEGLYADYGVGTGATLTLSDSTGKPLSLSWVNAPQYHFPVEARRSVWGFSVEETDFNPPLTITLPWVGANLPPEARPTFTFDPGPNPQPGQEWQIDQTIEVLGEPVRILSARYITRADLSEYEWARFIPEDAYGFEMRLQAGPQFRAIALSIDSGFSADGAGTSGQPSERDENGIILARPLMGGSITGPLVISVPYVDIRHDWQITFDPRALAGSPAPEETAAPDFRLQIEQVIPLEDGYYLVGRTLWNDPRFIEVSLGGWDTRLLAPDGREIPIEPAWLSEIGISQAQPGQWAYRVYGRALPASLTLTMREAHVHLIQPYTFTFQPGADIAPGKTWALNQPLEVLGLPAQVISARYVTEGDLRGFEFSLKTDPRILHLPLGMESGIRDGFGGGGGSTPRDASGLVRTTVLTSGQFTGEPIRITIRGLVLAGPWQVTWDPPAPPPGATPFYAPQACLTLDSVKQALANPPALPPELTGKFLLMRGALAPEPSLFVASLSGSAEIPLAFGHGSLSPDGSRVAYSDENNQLIVMDIPSRAKTILGSAYLAPRWSPDGTKIAFLRQTPKGINIFVMNASGANLRQLTDSAENFDLRGWTNDGKALLIQTGSNIELLNVDNGRRSLLLETRHGLHNPVLAALSPGGNWLAYLEKVPGRMTPGLYLKPLPNGQPRLLAQLDYWSIFTPVFSPDGQWLAFSVLNGDTGMDTFTFVLNLATCQVFPLPLEGDLREWSP